MTTLGVTSTVATYPSRTLRVIVGTVVLLPVLCNLLCDSLYAQTQPAPDLTPSPADPTSFYEVYEDPAFTRAVRSNTRRRDGRPGRDYWQQYARYDIQARLRPESKRLDAHAEITYLNRSPDTLDKIAVHLRQNLFRGESARRANVPITGGVKLERVSVNGSTLSPETTDSSSRYEVNGTVGWLHLPRSLPPEDSVQLSFDWSYHLPPAPADGRQGHEDGVFYFGYWYPQIAVYDDIDGWVAEQYTGQAEFYMGKADYEVAVTVPAHWLVGATGRLQNAASVLSARSRRRLDVARQSGSVVSILEPDERGSGVATRTTDEQQSLATWRFTADSVRDFAWGTSERYVWDATRALVRAHSRRQPNRTTGAGGPIHEKAQDTVLVHSFYRPTAAASAWSEGAARYTRQAVEELSELLRPYPYPTMTAMEGVLRSGGMEYPMVTIMRPWADSLKLAGDLMHEVGHMWIPMEVGTNEKRYPWMDEGITQYNTAEAMRRVYGPGPRPGGRPNDSETGQRRTYLRIARQGYEVSLMRHGDSIPSSLYFDLPYDKAAEVLRALRGLVGDEAFREASQAFMDRWWNKHPTPYDYFNTISDITGRDLSWFWRTWFYTTATLDHAIQNVETKDDSTTITIVNNGRAPMPARVAIERVDGMSVRHTIPVESWLNTDGPQVVTVPATPKIVRVEIDPEQDFPDVDRLNQIWRHGR